MDRWERYLATLAALFAVPGFGVTIASSMSKKAEDSLYDAELEIKFSNSRIVSERSMLRGYNGDASSWAKQELGAIQVEQKSQERWFNVRDDAKENLITWGAWGYEAESWGTLSFLFGAGLFIALAYANAGPRSSYERRIGNQPSSGGHHCP